MLRDDHIGSLRYQWRIHDHASVPDRPYRLFRLRYRRDEESGQDFGPHESISAAQEAAVAIERYEREHNIAMPVAENATAFAQGRGI